MKNNKVIYTCITGSYDNLRDPVHTEEGWDYLCFTDNPSLESSKWEIRLLGDSKLDPVRKARQVKILYYQYVGMYDESLWVDAGYAIHGVVSKFLTEVNPSGACLLVSDHPVRKCVYEEKKQCEKERRDRPEVMEQQMALYRNEGYPPNNGLLETGLMYRRDGQALRDLMDLWWEEVYTRSIRDQLSVNYVLWKSGWKGLASYPANIKSNLVSHGGHASTYKV